MNLIETMRFAKDMGPSHPDSEHSTVMIDFDGVLSESSGPYLRGHFGPPLPEGLKLLRLCLQHKYNVVIFTARKETDLVANWLREQGFPHMYVTNHKIPASSYIDDRAIPWSTKHSKADDAIKYVKDPRATLGLHV
jgi:hypothetical protein